VGISGQRHSLGVKILGEVDCGAHELRIHQYIMMHRCS
jgi:hypothetical protein